MAYQQVNIAPISIHKKPEIPVEGIFTGRRETRGKFGLQYIWLFKQQKSQKPFAIYGFAKLNYAMEWVQIGSLCRVTGKGDINNPKTGRAEHQVLVEVDDMIQPTGPAMALPSHAPIPTDQPIDDHDAAEEGEDSWPADEA